MNSYRNRILDILQNSDLQTVTPKNIRLQLEQEFNVDLSQDKSELKTLIFQLLDTLPGNATNVLAKDTVSEKDTTVSEKDTTVKVNDTVVEKDAVVEKDTTVVEKDAVSEESTVSQEQTKRKRGFQRESYLSKELSVFLNKETCSRTQVTRELWDYIKARNLQDTKDKRYILTDDLLFTVLKKKRIHMFEMTKVVSGHIKEAVEEEQDSQDSSRIKRKKSSRKEQDSQDSSRIKRKKSSKTSGKSTSKKGGWNKEYKLSKELSMVLNTEKESRPQIVKKLWEYIKSKDLQDPKDKRFIKTDDLLFKVFKTKRLNGFKMNAFLNDHLFPDDFVSDDNVESLDDDKDNVSDDDIKDNISDDDNVESLDDDKDNISDDDKHKVSDDDIKDNMLDDDDKDNISDGDNKDNISDDDIKDNVSDDDIKDNVSDDDVEDNVSDEND